MLRGIQQRITDKGSPCHDVILYQGQIDQTSENAGNVVTPDSSFLVSHHQFLCGGGTVESEPALPDPARKQKPDGCDIPFTSRATGINRHLMR